MTREIPSVKIRVVRCRDGSYAVMEDGEITYGGGLSHEAAQETADELIAAADNVKTDDHDSPWSDIGYQERRERDHEDDCPF